MMRSLLCRSLAVAALCACTNPERLTSPHVDGLQVLDAKGIAPASYTPTDLGTYPGDTEAFAWAVNDAGSVVVMSRLYPSTGGIIAHWYMRTGSIVSNLDSGVINGISGGATTYVAGAISTAVRWTYSTSTGFSAPTALPHINGLSERGLAVNDLGDVAGGSGQAGIWLANGTNIEVTNPNTALYRQSEARDINNSTDAAISFLGTIGNPDRGYARMADGTMIELPPLSAQRSTYADGVSERIAGRIYVAGTSDDDNGKYNAVRWTIDVATHSIVETAVVPALSYSKAMADDGTLAGIQAGSNSAPFVWKVGGAVAILKTPKGSTSGRVWEISGNGHYVAGDAKFGSYRRAILWTAQ